MATLNPFEIYENFEKANGLAEYLPAYLNSINGKLAGAQEQCKTSLRRLGKLKKQCFNEENGTYTKLYNALKALELPINFEFHDEHGTYKLPDITPSQVCIDTCKLATELTSETAQSALAGGFTGALISFGAYSVVGLVGTASTGTAISSLGGVAATNATLAWFGGGAIAAGGLGVAGGMLAISALGAIPALLITGISLGAKSEKALYEGKAKLEELREYEKKTELQITKLEQIKKVADFARSLLKRLDALAIKFIPEIENLINSNIKGRSILNCPIHIHYNIHKAHRVCETMNNFTKINIINKSSNLLDNDAEKELKVTESVIEEFEANN